MSKGEDKLAKILTKEKIIFEREKSFKDLNNGRFRYDFYLPELCYILEWNGIQHYQRVSKFYSTRQAFEKAQENDRRKISYALANNIKIFCLPFFIEDKINTKEDIFKIEYLAKTRWHNDDFWRANKDLWHK